MANWQDENLSAILEYPFDFERFMEEQLRELNDLDERIFTKKALIQGLGHIIKQTEQKYQELEKRVYQEISIPDNAYEIVSTIVRKSQFDPTNDTLFPVIPMDLSLEKIRQALSTEELVYIGTDFLEADRRICKVFEKRTEFQGSASIGGEEKEFPVYIKKAERYKDAIEQLYQMFQDNHIRWETVNIGYLDKLYDLYIPIEAMPAETVCLTDISIHYGEYEHLIQPDMLPLWNIEQITFDSMNLYIQLEDLN